MTYISDLLGTYVYLKVSRVSEHGAYLMLEKDGAPDDEVLLPGSDYDRDPKTGDRIKVFIYKDSEDRPVATVHEPFIALGEVAELEVAEVTSIGAFLNMGLTKDVLLPFKEQTRRVQPGERIPVALYVDKSERLAVTMHIYEYLDRDEEDVYQINDHVSGIVYEIIENFGAYVLVDGRYSAMIPKSELNGMVKVGDEVKARVRTKTDDGKLTLTLYEKKKVQMKDDAEKVFAKLEAAGGTLPFSDKTSPEIIKREFGMSKAAFKRALGRLYKEGRIAIGDTGISVTK
ncbi:MAG: S1 RNA-binding domain-containing protein [Eubacterium sp.]|nr:S1 RNA-binding domain-containing protein [Eubacterium sp.]